MKQALMCMCTAFMFLVAAAVAQTTPDQSAPGSQGTQSSSPSMNGQTAGQTNGNPDSMQGNSTAGSQGSNSGNMSGNTSSNSNGTMKGGEKKMKGCIQSQGGQYMLQSKHGKDIMLTGQDVSAHVGHEVTVHGMWEGGMSGMSNSSASSSGSASGKSFNVTSVDMISDTCSMGKGSKSGMSGNSGSGSGTGTGSGTTGTTGTTTPPQ